MRCLSPNCKSENTVEIGGVANSSTLVRCLDCNQTSWHPAKSTQFRIHWRTRNSKEIGQYTGLYSEAAARIWVNSLNADKDNKALGLEYWMEAVVSSEEPGE